MTDPRDPRATPTPGDDPRDAVAADRSMTAPGGAPDDAPYDATGRASDAAVARVRAADPAVGATPDTARLHSHLADATGVAFGADAATATSGAAATGAAPPADELAAARARRGVPARWLQVAAVAAGVALVGSGGYAVGAAGTDDPAAPPIALQGAAGAQGAGAGLGAPESAMASSDAMTSRIAPGWFGGRTVFTGSGLEGAAGSARAWTFDASSAATAATTARVAAVLGVAGEPRQEWGQWVVGANDGMGASVQVGIDGQAHMWFYDRAWDPSLCSSGLPETLDGSGAGGAEPGVVEPDLAEPDVAVDPVPAVEPVPAPGDARTLPDDQAMSEPALPQDPPPADPSVCDPASTPTGDAAIAAARDLMSRLGVPSDGYELTVSDDTGIPGLVSVTGAQVVDGTQTGLGWSVQLAGTGVQSVSGPLASLVELGTYDHISADEAVERLNDPRFGASYGGMMPLAARSGEMLADDSATMEAPADEPTVPPVPSAGDPVAWPVQEVTLTGARLGVTLLGTPTGASLLVPAWELTDADGATWSVIAVVEEQLDLSVG
ncbi:hypothetical protein [Cellulomonas sp. S1-8]|uniref:hypothetical protein n=1 Tax=Cellulomonas sp. S1-8 TaxID=2904790 RepID=UPI002244CC1F|nr:hypothetical protein [Cellulomonas sp. S1-8]UZN03986.1 hypothetical protein OKX07_03325 [Cellulomonas sp. S1-8]